MPKSEQDQDPFEQQLARALRRVDVRADTANKFLALVAEAEQQHSEQQHREQQRSAKAPGPQLVKRSSGGRVLAFRHFGGQARAWATGAVAAALIASVTLGGVHVEHQRERARTQKAERDFATAERIETATMQQVRQQVEQAGVPLD